MKRTMSILVGFAICSVALADAPFEVKDVTARQRYPWNGKVDISYTVENAGTETRELSVWAVDQTTGVTNVAKNVTGETAYASGKHKIVWDMSADGLTLVSTNVVFAVTYKEQPTPEGLYCVIDLSGGKSATSYPVSYLPDVPAGGWSDEYKTTKLVLRKISAGTFTMGSPTDELGRSDNETQHQVTLTKDYYVGVFPVTQRQWELVMGSRPSYFNNNDYYAPRPVEQVSYDMIRGSSAGAGWPNSSEVDATSFLGILRAKSGLQLDLPTEAQWEYACRAGTTTALNSGKNLSSKGQDSEMDKAGRYLCNGGSGGEYNPSCDWSAGTAKVGSYEPNAWGLYDMHGNVWEWCLDWYGSYSGDVTDPKGSSSGSSRVMRGGGWFYYASGCRSAGRGFINPSLVYNRFGFRLVRTLSTTAVAETAARSEAAAATSDGASVQGESDPVRVDLTSGTRTAAETETITYSTEWVDDAGEGVEAVVAVNGEMLSEQSGSGTVEWTPTKNGTYELTHKVMVGGEPVGETLTATFLVCHFPDIVFTATGYDGVYDGMGHGISVEVTDPVEGAVVTYSSTAKGEFTTSTILFTNVTDSVQSVYFKIAATGYQTVSGMATVRIAPRAVTLTSGSAEKKYDGTPLTNPDIAISGSGWASGEGATYDVTGSQTEIGESRNTFSYTLLAGTKAANYAVTKVEGTLRVLPNQKITDVTAQQRYPWNGKVDISYMVENAGTEELALSVWAVDQTTGVTNVAKAVTGDTAYTGGKHHIVWDMSADGLTLVSTSVVFAVTYKEQVKPEGLYCVIDLSGGTSATSYPVTYLDAVPSGGWSDGYKTSKLVLRKIPAGTFMMGSPVGELGRQGDEAQHRVTLTKDYYMGVFQVTQRQWELVMGTRPSYFNNNTYYAPRPVENVFSYDMIRGSSAGAGWPNSSAVDATSFLGILRAKTGLTLDLPTEAQWEYACRAGTTTALNSGKNLTSTDQDSEMDKVGRYWYNGGKEGDENPSCDWSAGTAKVGSYAPNAWGLYDMHGNVWEWCLDWYGSYSGDATDPKGSSSGSGRVLRGGSWSRSAFLCRSAYRYSYYPSYVSLAVGFRLVRTLSNTAVAETAARSEAVAATSGGASVQGESDPGRVDLTSGTRTAAETETITYSTEWVEGAGEGAVAVVSVNGEVISEQSGSGTVEWTPTKNGTYELTHKVMVGGEPVGETLTATFEVVLKPEPIDDCITFSSAASFTLKANSGKTWDGTLWTSTDKTSWTEWEGAEVSAAKTGDMYNLYVRGNEDNTKITGDVSGGRWVLSGDNIACTGNIETLRGATGNDPSPTKMADYCYYDMFWDCTALTSAPELPATTLANWCYWSMFGKCTALMEAPTLPATTLADFCYCNMFYNCTALTRAPTLPATTLANGCYWGMFSDCTSLMDAPMLRATELACECYREMFRDCTALTSAPALPVTTLERGCYYDMFSGCTSLKDAPELPATTLSEQCYYGMFSGCTALDVNASAPGKEWKIPATSTWASDWGTDMFAGTKGTLQGQPELNTTYYIASAPLGPIEDCITFSSATPFTLKTHDTSMSWDGTLWTSTDKTNWTEWVGAEVSAAQTGGTYYLYVRGNAANAKITGDDSHEGQYRWVLTGSNIACTGNIETLRGATGDQPSPRPMANCCYAGMFNGCTALTSAPALPATTLAKECYYGMFYGCTALTNAPVLPATELAEDCYADMFDNCTALTSAPVLPATTLADHCYSCMFFRCTSLTSAPALPATVLASYCYEGMFFGCTSLTDAPALPATVLADNCYRIMFEKCTSLTSAPELPATTLADYCYELIFWGCTSLTKAPALPATTLANGCYWGMFSDCTALKSAPVLPATTLAEDCYYYMFYGCTALTEAPALSAMTLASWCYTYMFHDCKSLTKAPALPATTLANGCYYEMFYGCTALTSAPALPATTLASYCYEAMFFGCTSLEVNTAAPGKEWKIPATSTTASNWGTDMFTGTKGTLQGQPTLNTTYYIASAPQEPIEPGGEIVVPEGKAEEKAAEINGDPAVKAQYLKAPGGIETTAQYRECFDAVATSGSTVEFVLNEEGTNQVVEATTAAKTNTLESVLSKTGTLVIGDPLIGFYYSLKQGSDVTVGDKADLNKLAGRDTLSFPLTTDKSKYFYQSLVTPTPVPTK